MAKKKEKESKEQEEKNKAERDRLQHIKRQKEEETLEAAREVCFSPFFFLFEGAKREILTKKKSSRARQALADHVVGSMKLYVFFAEFSPFYRALLQKRPLIVSI